MIYKISFLGCESFFVGYTGKSLNAAVNDILFKSYYLEKNNLENKYDKLYKFIKSVGTDKIILEKLADGKRTDYNQFLKRLNPPLN